METLPEDLIIELVNHCNAQSLIELIVAWPKLYKQLRCSLARNGIIEYYINFDYVRLTIMVGTKIHFDIAWDGFETDLSIDMYFEPNRHDQDTVFCLGRLTIVDPLARAVFSVMYFSC